MNPAFWIIGGVVMYAIGFGVMAGIYVSLKGDRKPDGGDRVMCIFWPFTLPAFIAASIAGWVMGKLP